MKILCTGGYGFIATNFFQYLAAKEPDEEIWLFDKRFGQDFTDMKQIDEAVEGADICFHFGAKTHVDESIYAPYQFHWNNYIGTYNVLEACRKHKVKLIFISTSEVYGSADKAELLDGRMTESHSLRPQSPYAASKTAADRLCWAHFITYGQDVVIVRPFNQYGPYQADEKAIPKFIDYAAKGIALPVYADGSASRDWVFVKDTVKGIWLARNLEAGMIVNLATGKDYNLMELVDIIDRVVNKKRKTVTAHITPVADRPGHVMRLCGDSSKMWRLTGWEAKTGLEKGIEITADWYFSNGIIKPPAGYLFKKGE